jgi:hypothetical protein
MGIRAHVYCLDASLVHQERPQTTNECLLPSKTAILIRYVFLDMTGMSVSKSNMAKRTMCGQEQAEKVVEGDKPQLVCRNMGNVLQKRQKKRMHDQFRRLKGTRL